MESAVAFQIFNRPDLTQIVFDEIAAAQPPQLFVFADGPRSDADVDRCLAARDVASRVSWDCDVHLDFSDVNLGCRRRLVTGLNWAFAHVDELIFLEDDDLPDPSFFPFCETLLEHSRDDPDVLMISGCNYLQRWRPRRGRSSHMSHLGSPWGFRLWKRAWALYDDSIDPRKIPRCGSGSGAARRRRSLRFRAAPFRPIARRPGKQAQLGSDLALHPPLPRRDDSCSGGELDPQSGLPRWPTRTR